MEVLLLLYISTLLSIMHAFYFKLVKSEGLSEVLLLGCDMSIC